MGLTRLLHRSYKAVRNAGLVVLGGSSVLFSFVLSRIFGTAGFDSLGGEAFADAPSYAQGGYEGDGGYSQGTYGGDAGGDCCSGGGDSCG